MATHVSHVGVHDHGFNNVSTYGTLWRLMREGRVPDDPWQRHFCELALKVSGAVQAARWTEAGEPDGAPTARGERRLHLLLQRPALALRRHDALAALAGRGPPAGARADGRARPPHLPPGAPGPATPRPTPRYNVYFGEGRDTLRRARAGGARERLQRPTTAPTAAPARQQGYSPVHAPGRGATPGASCGYPEQLEFLETVPDADLEPFGGRAGVEGGLLPGGRCAAGRLLPGADAPGRRPVLGHRRAGPGPPGRLPGPPGRSVQRPRAGRQLGRGDRGAGAAAAGQLPDRRRRAPERGTATGGPR